MILAAIVTVIAPQYPNLAAVWWSCGIALGLVLLAVLITENN
jgi:tellurite resistance protein TehA-like permease